MPGRQSGLSIYTLQEKDFSVGRQSLADKRREMIPALRDLYLETYSSSGIDLETDSVVYTGVVFMGSVRRGWL